MMIKGPLTVNAADLDLHLAVFKAASYISGGEKSI